MSRQSTEITKRSGVPAPATVDFDPKLIEALAYQNWQERGSPIGTDQEDWFQAEAQLRATQPASKQAA